MARSIRIECYLLGPFGQPAFVVTLPGQLRPEECIEVVNVQQRFLLDNLALALGAVDKTINGTTNGGRYRVLLLTLGP